MKFQIDQTAIAAANMAISAASGEPVKLHSHQFADIETINSNEAVSIHPLSQNRRAKNALIGDLIRASQNSDPTDTVDIVSSNGFHYLNGLVLTSREEGGAHSRGLIVKVPVAAFIDAFLNSLSVEQFKSYLSTRPETTTDELRRMVAKLNRASGCSCCRDCDKWNEALTELGEALEVPEYDDGSGHDWYSIGETAT